MAPSRAFSLPYFGAWSFILAIVFWKRLKCFSRASSAALQAICRSDGAQAGSTGISGSFEGAAAF